MTTTDRATNIVQKEPLTRRLPAALTVGLAGVAAAMSIAGQVLRVPTWDTWPARLALLVALLVAAAVDVKHHVVPPVVSRPLLVGAAARAAISLNLPGLIALGIVLWDVRIRPPALERVVHGLLVPAAVVTGLAWGGDESHLLTTLVWLLVWRMWRRNWTAGGDGMLIIALVGLYPRPEVPVGIALGWLMVGLLWMARLYGQAFLSGVLNALLETVAPRTVSREELEGEGVPMAAAIATGWMAYLALLALWPGGSLLGGIAR